MFRYNYSMSMLRKLSIIALKISLIFLISIILAVVLLFLAYLIPVSSMFDNAKISSEVLTSEGKYKELFWMFFGKPASRLDNFTDSVMISEAIFESDKSSLFSAMFNYHSGWGVEGLANQVNGIVEPCSYSRYWNGYLIFLKPLLMIFSIRGIRILNIILQSLLVVGVCYVFFKKEKRLIIPYLLAICFINPMVITQSMQFSSIFYLMNIGVLIVTLFYEKLKSKNILVYFFLMLGILTSFFDFLTYPLAALTMPLVVVVWFDKSETFKEKFIEILKICVFWAIGYFGFWIAKWVVGSVITGENLITEALNQAKYRTTGEIDYAPNQVLVYLAFIINLIPFVNIACFLIFVLCIVALILVKIVFETKFVIEKKYVYSFLLIVLMQIVWYTVLSNHSYMHFWFTFRAYVGPMFAVFAMIAYGFKNFKNREKEISNEKENSSTSTML